MNTIAHNKQVGGIGWVGPPQPGWNPFTGLSNTFNSFSNPFRNFWGSNRPPGVYDPLYDPVYDRNMNSSFNMNPHQYRDMNVSYRYGGKKRYIKSKAKKIHSIKKRNTKKNVKKILNSLKKQQKNISFSQAISG